MKPAGKVAEDKEEKEEKEEEEEEEDEEKKTKDVETVGPSQEDYDQLQKGEIACTVYVIPKYLKLTQVYTYMYIHMKSFKAAIKATS